MCILALILSIILIIVIAKWDKKLSTIKNKKPFVIEEPEWCMGWIEYYKGRINIYLTPPASLQHMIDAKNTSVQTALTAESDVKTAEATAKIAVAKANGVASANIAEAKGEYEAAKFRALANKELQSSYTDNFVKVEWIRTWDGKLPTTSLGSNTPMINISK